MQMQQKGHVLFFPLLLPINFLQVTEITSGNRSRCERERGHHFSRPAQTLNPDRQRNYFPAAIEKKKNIVKESKSLNHIPCTCRAALAVLFIFELELTPGFIWVLAFPE